MSVQRYPDAARPCVEVIRALVKKPLASQRYTYRGREGRISFLVENRRVCCPLGMLPGAEVQFPTGPHQLPEQPQLEAAAIDSFWIWHDNQRADDAQEVIDMIWDEEVKA